MSLLRLSGMVNALLAFGALLVFTATARAALPPAASALRVESVACPVAGVGVWRPRFGWALTHPDRNARQTAYRVTVAETTAGAVVWDSGTVASNATIGVQCGVDLTSDTSYKVTVAWTDHNGVTAPAATGAFTTALLNQVRAILQRLLVGRSRAGRCTAARARSRLHLT